MKKIEWTKIEAFYDDRTNIEKEFETEYGNLISLALVVLPDHPENPDNSRFTLSLVNDSNYYLSFCILSDMSHTSSLLYRGVIEPNISQDLATLRLEGFSMLQEVRIQAFAFKVNKLFECQPIIDSVIPFDTDTLRKASSYTPGLYSDQKVKELMIIKDGKPVSQRIEGINELVSASSSLSTVGRRRKKADNPNRLLDDLEIDLHISELVDSTIGMDNYSMLQLQLDEVRKTMNLHSKRIGQKIIFIHGKGDGVLRNEVRKLLGKEYPSCTVEDASFRKYGFGATSVVIHRNPSSQKGH
ncbi:MAG: DUF2027 domain-containing protein [Muribaculaceae bacterium]|nr:DUF2027 domain-containing protein [Muribaculaceae bacterium]